MHRARGQKSAAWPGGPDLASHCGCSDTLLPQPTPKAGRAGGAERPSLLHRRASWVRGCKQERGFCGNSWSERHHCYFITPFLTAYFRFLSLSAGTYEESSVEAYHNSTSFLIALGVIPQSTPAVNLLQTNFYLRIVFQGIWPKNSLT